MAQLVERKLFSKNALYIAAGLFGLALAASFVLWAKLGTTLFFESIRTGLAYCFG
jgi:hypothetical protein